MWLGSGGACWHSCGGAQAHQHDEIHVSDSNNMDKELHQNNLAETTNHYSDLSRYDTSFLYHLPSNLPNHWLLLYSCSNRNVIAEKSLLYNIHHWIHPSQSTVFAGKVPLHQMGYSSAYPETVSFNPATIANIMSLSSVAKYY